MLAEFIPESFFAAQQSLLLWLIAGGAIAMLVFGADRAVGAAVKLAAALGMSKVIIGATVVSLGTTTPEACTSVMAAISGKPAMALGNGVGSIICDTALIFGLCCCITRLPRDRFVLNRHGWIQLGTGAMLTAIVLVLWAVSGDIARVEIPRLIGVCLLLLLGGYMALSVHWSRRHPEMIPDEAKTQVTGGHGPRRAVVNLVILAGGLILVAFGSRLLIGSVVEVCHRMNVPEEALAVTLVAFGTSLPELATAIAAIIKGHPDLLVGNIIGADILNVLFVIGASATAVPLSVKPTFFTIYLPVMMAALILLRVYICMRGNTFKRWQGIPLLGLYVLFCILTLRFGTAA